MVELPTPLCSACLFVFARELLPAFGPIAASSSFTCHRLTRMTTNKDAFLKLQGEAQKANQESLRRPRLTDFWSPHHVKATSTFQPTFSLAAPDPFQLGLSFCSGLRAMYCLFPGFATTTLQKKTSPWLRVDYPRGGQSFSNGPASFWVSLLFRVFCSTE